MAHTKFENLNPGLNPLSCRKVMYHGPVNGALPFFAALGFVCPERKDPASFLQEVTTPKGGSCVSSA